MVWDHPHQMIERRLCYNKCNNNSNSITWIITIWDSQKSALNNNQTLTIIKRILTITIMRVHCHLMALDLKAPSSP